MEKEEIWKKTNKKYKERFLVISKIIIYYDGHIITLYFLKEKLMEWMNETKKKANNDLIISYFFCSVSIIIDNDISVIIIIDNVLYDYWCNIDDWTKTTNKQTNNKNGWMFLLFFC